MAEQDLFPEPDSADDIAARSGSYLLQELHLYQYKYDKFLYHV